MSLSENAVYSARAPAEKRSPPPGAGVLWQLPGYPDGRSLRARGGSGVHGGHSMVRRVLWMTAAIGLALLCWNSSAGAADHKYVGAKGCKSCHKKELIGNQYGEWEKGEHAKAFETLKGEKAAEIAKKKGITEPPF